MGDLVTTRVEVYLLFFASSLAADKWQRLAIIVYVAGLILYCTRKYSDRSFKVKRFSPLLQKFAFTTSHCLHKNKILRDSHDIPILN